MEDVLLRSLFVKTDDGYLEVRYYGRRVVWVGPAPVSWMYYGAWPWLWLEPSPSLAIVKEGPKALVLAPVRR
jgi:hypothetical protein